MNRFRSSFRSNNVNVKHANENCHPHYAIWFLFENAKSRACFQLIYRFALKRRMKSIVFAWKIGCILLKIDKLWIFVEVGNLVINREKIHCLFEKDF